MVSAEPNVLNSTKLLTNFQFICVLLINFHHLNEKILGMKCIGYQWFEIHCYK